MAWPFANVTAPNVDSGWADPGAGGVNTFSAIPNSPTGAQWVLGFWFANTAADEVTVSVADANGVVFIPAMTVPANTPLPVEAPFPPVIGPLQWKCSVPTGVNAKYWGFA